MFEGALNEQNFVKEESNFEKPTDKAEMLLERIDTGLIESRMQMVDGEIKKLNPEEAEYIETIRQNFFEQLS